MTDEEISRLISYTQVLWTNGRDIDRREQVVAWREQLSDVPELAARAAVDDVSAAGREFAPPPGLIRRRAMVLAAGADAPSPERAWAEVLAKIGTQPHSSTAYDTCPRWHWRSGPECPVDCPHRIVEWSHPAIAATVEGLGYRSLCESSEPMADRAHFLRLYQAAVDRVDRLLVMPASVAAIEASAAALELGPPTGEVRALPSGPMSDDERDDEAGMAQVRAVRDALAAQQKAED